MYAIDPVTVRLDGHFCTHVVAGFTRRRVGPAMLTLAVATYTVDGCAADRECTDTATLMRLADLLSDRHDLPVNGDALYGSAGRGCEVGREAISEWTLA